MVVVGLKILAPLFLFASVVYSEWSKPHDKSERRRAVVLTAMGAVVAAATVTGLVYEHGSQAAAVAAAQKEAVETRREVTATREEVTETRTEAAVMRQELRGLKESTDAVVALYPGLTEQEALDRVADELRGLRERSTDLEDQLAGLMTYRDVAELDVSGVHRLAGSGIGWNGEVARDLEGTWVDRDGRLYPRCDQTAVDKYSAAAVNHPTFPFAHYALSECAFGAGTDTWRQPAEHALRILRHTTQIAGRHPHHDAVSRLLRSRLEQP